MPGIVDVTDLGWWMVSSAVRTCRDYYCCRRLAACGMLWEAALVPAAGRARLPSGTTGTPGTGAD
jgi:hypothetical protein